MGGRLAFTITTPAPGAANSATAARQRQAAGRVVRSLQALLDQIAPDDLELISSRLEQALNAPTIPVKRAALLATLTDGHEYGQQEQVALELATLVRSFRFRQELLANSLTAPQVAELLGTSRQTPHDRAKSGALLAVLDRGALRFPRWQFDPEKPDGVVPGLPEVLRALHTSPLAKVSWLVRLNPYLEQRTPLQALKDNELERVTRLAGAVGIS